MKGADVKDIIAVNGVARRPSTETHISFNFDGAVANFVWFSGI
jgi:hypothetical protein